MVRAPLNAYVLIATAAALAIGAENQVRSSFPNRELNTDLSFVFGRAHAS